MNPAKLALHGVLDDQPVASKNTLIRQSSHQKPQLFAAEFVNSQRRIAAKQNQALLEHARCLSCEFVIDRGVN